MAHRTGQLFAVPDLVLIRIIGFLDLPSVKSLRLTCKLLSQRCLTHGFPRYIRRQSTELTVSALDRLLELARHERLGPMVRELIILGTVFDMSALKFQARWKVKEIYISNGVKKVDLTAEELNKVEEELEWMTVRQQEADYHDPETVISRLSMALKQFGSLSSINLDLCVYQGRKSKLPSTDKGTAWYPRFAQASNTFYLATSAIARSGVELGAFTIFRDTVNCSIPIADVDRMLKFLKDQGLSTAANNVTTLALNLLSYIKDDQQGDLKPAENHPALRGSLGPASPDRYTADNPEANEPENITGLADFVAIFQYLEALDIRLFTTIVNSSRRDLLFTKLISDIELSRLVRVALRGLSLTEESLIRFLQNHAKLVDLTLENIMMTTGTWSPIFDHLHTSMPDLQRLHLSTLWGRRLLNLEPIDPDTNWDEVDNRHEIGFRCRGGYLQHTRTIGRKELEAGLKFKPAPGGRSLGSLALIRWRDRLKLLYGPP